MAIDNVAFSRSAAIDAAPMSSWTVEALQERLGLAAPLFAADLQRLAALDPNGKAYADLVEDILARAPTQAQLDAAEAVRQRLGYGWRRFEMDLARLAMMTPQSTGWLALMNQMQNAKIRVDITRGLLELDTKLSQEFIRKMEERKRKLAQ